MKIIATIDETVGNSLVPVMDMCGKPVLQWVLQKTHELDVEAVLLTSNQTKNISLKHMATKMGVQVIFNYNMNSFWDGEAFYWYYGAIKKFEADYIVVIRGDAPFFDVDLANELIKEVRADTDEEFEVYEHVCVNKKVSGWTGPSLYYQEGMTVQVVDAQAIKEIMANPFFFTRDYSVRKIDYPGELSYKVSVDSEQALDIACEIMKANNDCLPRGWEHLEQILKGNPELRGKCEREL